MRAVGVGSNKVSSVPDAIAQAIGLREQEKAGIQQELIPDAITEVQNAADAAMGLLAPATASEGPPQLNLTYDAGETFIGTCPECKSQLEFAEGCMKCHVCGFSECG